MNLTFLGLASSVLLTAQSTRPADLLSRNVNVAEVGFKGRTATRLTDKATGDLPDGKSYNAFYLRPYDGRSKDQVQRNYSAQYISLPEVGWRKLREAYVDLVPEEWNKVIALWLDPFSLSHFSNVRIAK